MTYGTPTWFEEVLKAVRTRVQTAVDLPESKVFITLAGDGDHLSAPPGDRFAVIRPGGFPVAVGVAGGGRASTGHDGAFGINLFARYNSDQELRNAKLLTDSTLGIMSLAFKLINGVQLHEPVNVNSVVILREPMRMTGLAFDSTKAKDGNLWGVVRTSWEASFNLNITVPSHQTA